MTISLDISPKTQERLEKLASQHGQGVEAFISALLERTVMSIDGILLPIRQGFVESGMREAELLNLIDTEIEAVRQSKKSHR